MKRNFYVLTMMLFILLPGVAMATSFQISVTNDGDYYYSHEWWQGGHYNHDIYGSSEIKTTYYYWPGDGGRYEEARLNFDLSSLSSINVDDIIGASINLDITSAYNNVGGTYAGGLSYDYQTDSVLATASGWTSFDITDRLKSRLDAGDTTAYFMGNHNGGPYDGWGYVFTSAEGGNPAYLDITTAGGNPVPEPTTLLLLGTGLIGLAGWGKRKKIFRSSISDAPDA